MRNGDEMLQQIVEKSALDAEFRQQLIGRSKDHHQWRIGNHDP